MSEDDAIRKAAEKRRRAILHAAEAIPPLPENVTLVLQALERSDTEPDDLVGILERDPVLVGRMLSTANSPFYGMSREISGIKQAIMVLGFRGLRSLMLATSTSRFMKQRFERFGHDNDGLWKHAVLVSAIARELGSHVELTPDQREELFIAALLHDIGKMAMVTLLEDEGIRIEPLPDSVEREGELLGIDHAEAGALVLSKWNLARSLQDLVAAHHDAPSGAPDPATALLRLADALAHELGIGYQPTLPPTAVLHDEDIATIGGGARWEAARVAAIDAAQRALDQFS